jgi:zinc/manganese transport system permease protein
MIDFIFWPLITCFILILIHGYFGAFVLKRGIIFIDLALAQWAALGYLVGHWLGIESPVSLFVIAFLGTVLASIILVGLKSMLDRINVQEASIGVMYIFATTLAMALISSTGMEGHHLKEMLSGHLLFVQSTDVIAATILYGAIALIVYNTHDQLLSSQSKRVDFMFYGLFGLVVTSSVKMVGVLLVFSFLVIPLLTVRLFVQAFKPQIFAAWLFGCGGAILGVLLALILDIPISLCIILSYVIGFFCSVLLKSAVKPHH